MACDLKPLRNGSSQFKPIQAIYGHHLISLDIYGNDGISLDVTCPQEAAAGNPAHIAAHRWYLIDTLGGSIEKLGNACEKSYYIWQLQLPYSYQWLQYSTSMLSYTILFILRVLNGGCITKTSTMMK